MKLGIGIDDTLTPEEEIRLAISAETTGFEFLCPVVNLYMRDGVTTAAAVLTRTQRLRVATGTVSVYLYHPIAIAIMAARLQALGQGRLVVILATGMPEALGRANVSLTRPLVRIRETIAILRQLFGSGRADFPGEIFSLRGYRLAEKPSRVPPIYIAAMGPKMLELAGEIADGVLLPAAGPLEYVSWAVERVKQGADKAGRRLEEVEIASNVVVEASPHESAWSNARRLIAFHLSSPYFEPVTAPAGVVINQSAIKAAFQRRDWQEIARLVPDPVLKRFAAVGTGHECLKTLKEYSRSGATLPIALPVGGTADQMASMSTLFRAYTELTGSPTPQR